MRNSEIQIDTWSIKMLHKMVIWGMITPRIESIVTCYSIMIDNARTIKDKREIEHEFVVTMLSHGIVCEL